MIRYEGKPEENINISINSNKITKQNESDIISIYVICFILLLVIIVCISKTIESNKSTHEIIRQDNENKNSKLQNLDKTI